LWTSLAAGLAIAGLLVPGVTSAQAPAAGDPVVTPPEDVVLETKDGVRIVATYFAGAKAKESVPVILLHDFNGDRQDMFPLAEYLQKTHGFAIMVPDLRGHGQSTTVKNSSNKLSASTMPLNQYPLMVSEDMEKVKSWLVAKNNAAELNIDKLSIVGAGMGATVATLFAARDWEWPILSTGKQGQDVKAVAMISPEFVFKSLNMQAAFGQPGVQKSVSFYIMAGLLDSKATAEANRIYKALTAHRRPETDPKDRTLFLEPSLKTKLQGVKLLTEPELGVSRNIGQFIELRSGTQPFPWANRPNPLG
jgi:pimeloyl-ACP methyl ester carboxylesterase